MDKKGKRIIGGITLGVYVLLLADFVVSLCRAFAQGTEDGVIMASYVFVPFIIFAVITAAQAVLFFGTFKITPVVHDIIALAKCIIVLLCILLFGFTVLRSSWYSIDGITAWNSLSCPVYATILVSVYIALTFICAACEIIYIMRDNMEQNILQKHLDEARAKQQKEAPGELDEITSGERDVCVDTTTHTGTDADSDAPSSSEEDPADTDKE
ncbi:MAG: hypothetical protein LUD51_04400 [Clostridia bacterium]|nr:hypothetical protein [Clostridia bacterium]